MEQIDNLFNCLKEIQNIVIGVYKCGDSVEVVIGEDEYTFTTLNIGDLLGLSTSKYNKPGHTFTSIPDGKTLGESLNTPDKLFDWVKTWR